MVQLNFNAQQYAPNAGGMDVLPSGIYDVQITASEVKQTKRGDGYMLVFTMSVISGSHVGRRIMARLNIQNPNAQAMEIAYGELSAISHVVGIMAWQDTQELHGRPFKVKVDEVARSDDPTKMGNEIKGYYDYTGNPPTPRSAGAGPSAAPAAPVAPTAPAQPQQPAPAQFAQEQAPAQAPAPAAAAAPAYAPAPTPAPAPALVQPPQGQALAPAAPWQTGAPAPQPVGETPPWQR